MTLRALSIPILLLLVSATPLVSRESVREGEETITRLEPTSGELSSLPKSSCQIRHRTYIGSDPDGPYRWAGGIQEDRARFLAKTSEGVIGFRRDPATRTFEREWAPGAAWGAPYDLEGKLAAFKGDGIQLYHRDQGAWKPLLWFRPFEQGNQNDGAIALPDENTLLVGDPLNDTLGFNAGAVQVHAIDREGGTRERTRLLLPEATAQTERIGYGNLVRAEGDNLAVLGFDSGVQFLQLYHRGPDGEWRAEDVLRQPGEGFFYRFGTTTFSGDTLAIGGGLEESGVPEAAGAVFVWRRDPLTARWMQEAVLRAPDPVENGNFGNAVAMHGNRLLVASTPSRLLWDDIFDYWYYESLPDFMDLFEYRDDRWNHVLRMQPDDDNIWAGREIALTAKEALMGGSGLYVFDLFDGDSDGIADACDLCPEIADPLQRDSDGDGRGDACEWSWPCVSDLWEADDACQQPRQDIVVADVPRFERRTICGGRDEDVFRFYARRFDSYAFETLGPLDTRLSLQDDACQSTLAQASDCRRQAGPACLEWEAPETGWYRLRVQGETEGLKDDYILRHQEVECARDAWEPESFCDTTIPLEIGFDTAETPTRTLCPLGEDDWFSFEAREGEIFRFAGDANSSVVSLSIMDESCSTVIAKSARCENPEGEEGSCLIWEAPASGSYRLRVRTTSAVEYRIHHRQLASEPVCVIDTAPDDGDCENATLLADIVDHVDIERSLCPAGDWDHYLFVARAGEFYQFTILGDTDTVLILRDEECRGFLLDDDRYPELPGTGSYIGWRAPRDGLFYLRVRGYSPETTGAYRLLASERKF